MKNKFNDNLKVLAYGNISKLSSIMSSHFLDQLTNVSDEITQEPRTINELNSYINGGKFTHVMIPDEHFHILKGSLEKCVVPVVELLGDHWVSWAVDKKKKYMLENGIKDALVFSRRFQEPYKNHVRFHPVLTGFNSSVFSDKASERDIDVLVSGSLGQDTFEGVYPVRNWLAKVLPEIGIKEGINVGVLDHPGYSGGDKNSLGPKDYAHILNRSKIAVGGSSFWRLPLKKFYEIPASGAILLSDLPLEDKNFFKSRIIEVDPNKIKSNGYKDEIRKNIMYTLENYEKFKGVFQPFRTEGDIFNRSYEGKSLEIRAALSTI